MNLLAMIPLRAWAYLGAVLALVAGLAFFVHHERDIGRAEVRAEWAAERAALQAAAASATALNQTESIRRTAAQTEIAHDAETSIARLDAGRAPAVVAARGLRERAAAVAASCGATTGDPAASGPSPAASAPGVVLADVLGRLDDVAGELAEALDRSHIAGLACERSYDALTAPEK